jgi:hypothetical protein
MARALRCAPLALLLLAGCAAAEAHRRADDIRALLLREAPIGASRAQAMAVYAQLGLVPSRGTYLRVSDRGEVRSHCPDPDAALTARARTPGQDLFRSHAIEVTICLDPDERVVGQHVGVWTQ